MAAADSWVSFDADWRAHLDTVRVPFFHAGRTSEPFLFSVDVITKDFERARALFYNSPAFASPYAFCFHNCVQHILTRSKEQYKQESLAQFDEHEKLDLYKNRLGTIGYVPMASVPALQAADMIINDIFANLLCELSNAWSGRRGLCPCAHMTMTV